MKKVINKFSVLFLFVTAIVTFGTFSAFCQSPRDGLRSDYHFGADLSYMKYVEDNGSKFKEDGEVRPVIRIFADHGFNWARLRIFHTPSAWTGGTKQPNDLDYTIAMARQAKAYGLKVLLNFHYSDTWADPGAQTKPAAWANLTQPQLIQAVYDYTLETLLAFADAGVYPEMVQVGNEITPGFLWPNGRINQNEQGFIDLLRSAVNGVLASGTALNSEPPKIMIHIDKGGDINATRNFFNRLKNNSIHFDIIGQSYHPRWHGTMKQLYDNLVATAHEFDKDIIIAETAYSMEPQYHIDEPGIYPESPEGQMQFLEDLHKTITATPNKRGAGLFWWNPTANIVGYRNFFDKNFNVMPIINFFNESPPQTTISDRENLLVAGSVLPIQAPGSVSPTSDALLNQAYEDKQKWFTTLTASHQQTGNMGAYKVRMEGGTTWHPGADGWPNDKWEDLDGNVWLRMDFKKPVLLDELVVVGRRINGRAVTGIKIEFDDGDIIIDDDFKVTEASPGYENKYEVNKNGVKWVKVYLTRCGINVNAPDNGNQPGFLHMQAWGWIHAEGIKLNKTETQIESEKKERLIAFVQPAEATTQSVIWSSDNTNVATVDGNGLVIPVSKGEAMITAKTVDGGYEATCNVTVKLFVKSIKVTSEDDITYITLNDKLQMYAEVFAGDDVDKTVTWSVIPGTGNATIDQNGLLTPTALGTVTVRATANDGSGVYDAVIINISDQPVPVAKITVTGEGGATTITDKGGKLQLIATIEPVNAVDKTVTWSIIQGVGNATINATGELTAVADGVVTVRARANDGSRVYGELRLTISGQEEQEITSVDNPFAENLNIYPNPFTDEVRITGAQNCTLRVTDAKGVAVHIQQINNADEIIRLDQLSTGVYFFSVEKNGQIKTIKVVKN